MSTARLLRVRVSVMPRGRYSNYIGRVFNGDYRIVDGIGEGGFGVVLMAEHTRLHKTYALKVLPLRMLKGKQTRERFKQEAHILADLDNPNIVEVHDLNVAYGEYYFAMELLEGDNLDDHLKRTGALDLTTATRIVTQVSSALQAAHDKRIVHRDIKPANIFLCAGKEKENDWVKVVDFGLAKILDANFSRSLMVAGTPCYMAPECIDPKIGDIEPYTDIYSLGAVLYHMLAGVPPFDGPTMESIIYQVKYEEPKPLKDQRRDVHDNVALVIGRAMQKEPGSRHANVKDLAEELRQAAGRTIAPQNVSSGGEGEICHPEPGEGPVASPPVVPPVASPEPGGGLVAAPPVVPPVASPERGGGPVAAPPVVFMESPEPGEGPVAAPPVVPPVASRKRGVTGRRWVTVLVVLAGLSLIAIVAAGYLAVSHRQGDRSASGQGVKPDTGTTTSAPAGKPPPEPAKNKRDDAATIAATRRAANPDGSSKIPALEAPRPDAAPGSAPVPPARRRPRPPARPVQRPSPVPPGPASLRVGTRCGWANIRLDGVKKGRTPLVIEDVKAGWHLIEARRGKLGYDRKRIRVVPGQRKSVLLNPCQTRPPGGEAK